MIGNDMDDDDAYLDELDDKFDICTVWIMECDPTYIIHYLDYIHYHVFHMYLEIQEAYQESIAMGINDEN